MNKYRVAIIGGGATGLMVANCLTKENLEIYVLEKNNKLGKKILASGNGKCNYTNVKAKKGSIDNQYNNDFAMKILDKCDTSKVDEIFKNLGMLSREDSEGRKYPYSECSISVLDCLKTNLKHVKFMLDTEVKRIEKQDDKYRLLCGKETLLFDYVVCCSGSKASNLGSDKAYNYLDSLNIRFSELKPSLVPLIVKENVRELKGVRVKGKVYLKNSKNDIVYEEKNGEIIFKEDAISGIAIFNASSYINRKKDKYKIVVDVFNDEKSYSDIYAFLKLKKSNKLSLLKGVVNDKLAEYIYCKNKISEQNIKDSDLQRVSKDLLNLEFNIVGQYPLKEAQVCSGGIEIVEVSDNLELKKYPNVYVGGELLDVDAVCGGYNLQFAWSSAYVIAKNINGKVGEKYESEEK